MILADISNKDVESGMDKFITILGKITDGIVAVFNMLPPIVIGFIFFVLLILWLIRRARHG